ncbi:MAG: 23S rRNA (adenine(2503)-C(2))-methyltransferase RlmN [Gammaproteobacteria bacterium]|nr:MAG: 23S rRNA (adenine(2503)-C(2))-methyltransferase RlmN [Gammaproteobacteria bacterium]
MTATEDQSAGSAARNAAPATRHQAGINLFDLDRKAFEAYMTSLGEKPFRARQIMKWLYQRQQRDVQAMTDVAQKTRNRLAACTTTVLPSLQSAFHSSDGTIKWLFELHDGNVIETVYIPEDDRGTLCVSSQVGCALDCSFCATGRQGFNRNLAVSEIIGQLWLATRLLENDEATREQRITNVVMMGMGEPLLNYAALVSSLELMMDDLAYGLSKRRVTVSTSGVVPAMDRLTRDVDCSLALSLHAPNNELRSELVPLNRKYPIEAVMDACWRYVESDDAASQRKKHVLFEYVMLAGVNDQPEHAQELAALLQGFPGKVNLIPFNPFPQSGYRRSPRKAVDRFAEILGDAGVLTLKRTTRGDDIDAACGQLAGDIDDRSRRELRFVKPRFGEVVS